MYSIVDNFDGVFDQAECIEIDHLASRRGHPTSVSSTMDYELCHLLASSLFFLQ